MIVFGSATDDSLLVANLWTEEIPVGVSVVGVKIRTPDLAGRGIDDEPLVRCTRNLVTSDGAWGSGGSNAESNQNTGAQPDQCTVKV